MEHRFGHQKISYNKSKSRLNLNLPFIELAIPDTMVIALPGLDLENGSNYLFISINNGSFNFYPYITGSFSSVSNPGGGNVRITSSSHGLNVGDGVSIFQTSDFDYIGYYPVVNVPDSDNFDITATWAGDESGTWERGDLIVPKYDGLYNIDISGVWRNFGTTFRTNRGIFSKNGILLGETEFDHDRNTNSSLTFSFSTTVDLKKNDKLMYCSAVGVNSDTPNELLYNSLLINIYV